MTTYSIMFSTYKLCVYREVIDSVYEADMDDRVVKALYGKLHRPIEISQQAYVMHLNKKEYDRAKELFL